MARTPSFGSTLAAIVIVGVIVRLGVVVAVHADGYYMTDEVQYIHMAERILAGQGFISENGEFSTIAPLYIFFLAGVFASFGSSLAVSHMLGCALGVCIVMLSYMLSLEVFKSERPALWTAAVCAIYPSLAIYSGLLLTETLYIVLLMLAFLLAYKAIAKMGVGTGLLLGIVAGLATLTRAVFFGFFPILILTVWWIRKRENKYGIKALVLAVVMWCIVLSPWTIRNYSIHHAVVPVSTGGGKVLLVGNNPFAPTSFRADGFEEWLKREALARGVPDLNALSEIDLFSVYASIAIGFMVSHPMETLTLAVQKLHIFWIYPIAHSDSDISSQMVVMGGDALLYIGSVIGLAACWQHRRRLLPLFLAVGFFCGVQIVLHSEARFRLPVVPFLCMLCGYGIAMIGDTMERKRFVAFKPGMVWAGAGVVSVVLAYGYTGVLFLTGKIT